MKFANLLAVAASLVASASASDCDYVDGNYYCDEVSKIIYKNVGFSGSYSDISSMDEDSGDCSSSTLSFSGTLSPLDEELSVHFRGPLKLLQFGVYYPASSSSNAKRDDDEDCTTTQHVHHKHVKRATAFVTETVYVNQNGELVTSTATATAAASTAGALAGVESVVAGVASAAGSAASAVKSAVSSVASAVADSASSSSASAGDWERVSYYEPGSTSNCTFLNHYGGSGSGVWSSAFGNSLSYCNSDASGGASKATALEETTIDSNVEYLIMSGVECGDDSELSDCGYYRDGTVAYHGWSGKEKIFVFEFEMPSDSSSGTNADMPAIWMLNAKIPRTLQYGSSDCSCWDSGCGELDLFEILSAGSAKLISHLHDKQAAVDGYGGGGSSNYFSRPTSSSVKAAVIFTDGEVHIQTLDSDVDFDSVLSSSTVSDWVAVSGTDVTISS